MLRDTVINWRKEWRHLGLEEGWLQGMKEGRKEGMAQGLERGVEQGVARGRREGRQEGRREGEAAILLRLLEQRFGALPLGLRQRLDAADSAQLASWGEKLLSAGSLEEVFEKTA